MTRLVFFVTCLPLLAAADESAAFLPHWMGATMDAIGHLSLSNLSLPGTHDTMTWDLSTRISDGGIDDHSKIAHVLHELGGIPGVGSWIRTQAQTQGLNVTAQLDAGIRFLDFRVMYTSSDWYCLHMLQTNRKAITYHPRC